MDCTISSTGFINYFPSAERTQRAIDEAYAKKLNDHFKSMAQNMSQF